MKNKIIATVLTAVLSLGMLAGCAQSKMIDNTTVRVGSLKGPTTIGIVNLMDKASKGQSKGKYEFTMSAQADEIAAKVVSGDLDIALLHLGEMADTHAHIHFDLVREESYPVTLRRVQHTHRQRELLLREPLRDDPHLDAVHLGTHALRDDERHPDKGRIRQTG